MDLNVEEGGRREERPSGRLAVWLPDCLKVAGSIPGSSLEVSLSKASALAAPEQLGLMPCRLTPLLVCECVGEHVHEGVNVLTFTNS